MSSWSFSIGPVPVADFDAAAGRAAEPFFDSSDTATGEQIATVIAAAAAVVEQGVLGGERVGCTVSGTAMPGHRRDGAPSPAAITIALAFYDSVGRAEESAQASDIINGLVGVPPAIPVAPEEG